MYYLRNPSSKLRRAGHFFSKLRGRSPLAWIGIGFRLAKKSRSRSLKEDILPAAQSRVELEYNDALPKFIRESWNAESARKHNPNLDKTLVALGEYVRRQERNS